MQPDVLMFKKTPVRRKMHSPWTASEDNRLLMLWMTALSIRQISNEMGRNERAIRQRVAHLGLCKRPWGGKKVSSAEAALREEILR